MAAPEPIADPLAVDNVLYRSPGSAQLRSIMRRTWRRLVELVSPSKVQRWEARVDISTGPGDGGMPLRIVIRRALALAQVIAPAQRGDTIAEFYRVPAQVGMWRCRSQPCLSDLMVEIPGSVARVGRPELALNGN